MAPGSTTNAYDLITAAGGVYSYGGAHNFGSVPKKSASSRIIGAAATPGGNGYWLLGADGHLYAYGDAIHYGTPYEQRHVGSFVGLAVTPDGGGLLAVTDHGSIVHLGNAPFCGSPVHQVTSDNVVGIVPTPDGNGYWVFTSDGTVYPFGDARAIGSGHGPGGSPAVGLAATADGGGYWIAYADGAVRQFGDAPFYGSPAHAVGHQPVIGIAATRNGAGYWVATDTGQVYGYGQAVSHGSLGRAAASAGHGVVAVVATAAKTTSGASAPPPPPPLPPLKPLKGDPYAHGAIGYDISNFQCNRHAPARTQAGLPARLGLSVLQVAGWLDSSLNSCLAAETSWANRAAAKGDPPSLYLFMNAPTNSTASRRQAATGPAGRCATRPRDRQASCRAYNYGYNGARHALAYATARGTRSSLWWIDIENAALARGEYANFGAGQYWSANRKLNDRTIQGAIDALRASKITVGIYSSSLQYSAIAGNYVPAGKRVPLWIAGVPWTKPPYHERGLPSTAALASWCAGTAHYQGSKKTDLFAGGVPWLLQETPGVLPSPYGIDPDYAC